MTAAGFACWRCAGALGELPRPLPRASVCPACGADLHVCRMCRFFDPSRSRGCREPVADHVRDRERANFCGYLEPSPDAGDGRREAEARAAREALDALFGLDRGPPRTEPPSPSSPRGRRTDRTPGRRQG